MGLGKAMSSSSARSNLEISEEHCQHDRKLNRGWLVCGGVRVEKGGSGALGGREKGRQVEPLSQPHNIPCQLERLDYMRIRTE